MDLHDIGVGEEEYLQPHTYNPDEILQPRTYNPKPEHHITAEGQFQCGVADYMDYAYLAKGNPFNSDSMEGLSDSSLFAHTGSAVPNLNIGFETSNQSGETDIMFHAMDLEPVGFPSFPPQDGQWNALAPKALNVVNKRDLFHMQLSRNLHNENWFGDLETYWSHVGSGQIGQVSSSQVCYGEACYDENSYSVLLDDPETTIEKELNLKKLTLDLAPISPSQPSSSLSDIEVGERKKKLLWGENGLLGLAEDVPSKSARRKSGLFRGMTKKLKNQLAEIVDDPNKGLIRRRSSSAVKISAPGSSPASLTTSLDPVTQAKMYAELEVMICNTANDFILQQYYDGRVSQSSINKTNANWNSRNNHHVVQFRFDQATQREIIAANRSAMDFTGDASRFPICLQTNLHNWKTIAREMSIRTFCLPDTAIRKHLHDLRQIIDMMNPSLETLQAFNDLCTSIQDKMLDKATAERRQSEVRMKRGY